MIKNARVASIHVAAYFILQSYILQRDGLPSMSPATNTLIASSIRSSHDRTAV